MDTERSPVDILFVGMVFVPHITGFADKGTYIRLKGVVFMSLVIAGDTSGKNEV